MKLFKIIYKTFIYPAMDAGCEVTDWTPWSGCSSTCGTGNTTRYRDYVEPADNFRCNKVMTETAPCTDITPCNTGSVCL